MAISNYELNQYSDSEILNKQLKKKKIRTLNSTIYSSLQKMVKLLWNIFDPIKLT